MSFLWCLQSADTFSIIRVCSSKSLSEVGTGADRDFVEQRHRELATACRKENVAMIVSQDRHPLYVVFARHLRRTESMARRTQLRTSMRLQKGAVTGCVSRAGSGIMIRFSTYIRSSLNLHVAINVN